LRTNDIIRSNIYKIIGFLLLSAAITLPFFYRGYFSIAGNDMTFQVTRVESIVNSLMQGNIPGMTSFWGNSNIGTAINGMYPWGTLLLFAIPRIILYHHFTIAWMIGIWVVNFLTALFMYGLLKIITTNEGLRWLGTTLYLVSGYHLIIIYQRFALAEFLAYAFLPLVFLGVINILKGEKVGKFQLGLGMTLVAYSHLLSTMSVVPYVILLLLVGWLGKNPINLRQVKDLLVAVIFTLVTALPVVWQLIYIPMNNSILFPEKWGGISQYAIRFGESLNNILTFDIFGTEQPWKWHLDLFLIIFGAVSFLIFIMKLIQRSKDINRENILFGIATLIALFMPSEWFPWRMVPAMVEIIQFPGRLLTYSTIFLVMFVVMMFSKVRNQSRFSRYVVLVGVVFLMAGGVYTVWNQVGKIALSSEEKRPIEAELQYREGTFLDYQIAQRPTEDERVNRDLALQVHKNQVSDDYSILKKTSTSNTLDLTLGVTAASNKLLLPVYIYRGVSYTVDVDGKSWPFISHDGVLSVSLSAGKHVVQINAKSTVLYRIMVIWGITWLSILVVATIIYESKRYNVTTI
jgi:hypothetical protein